MSKGNSVDLYCVPKSIKCLNLKVVYLNSSFCLFLDNRVKSNFLLWEEI